MNHGFCKHWAGAEKQYCLKQIIWRTKAVPGHWWTLPNRIPCRVESLRGKGVRDCECFCLPDLPDPDLPESNPKRILRVPPGLLDFPTIKEAVQELISSGHTTMFIDCPLCEEPLIVTIKTPHIKSSRETRPYVKLQCGKKCWYHEGFLGRGGAIGPRSKQTNETKTENASGTETNKTAVTTA